MMKPFRTRTIGSSRDDKDLDMHLLVNLREEFSRLLAEIGLSLRDINEIFDQRGELVPHRDAEIAHAAFRLTLQHEGRNTGNSEGMCLLLIAHKILHRQVKFGGEVSGFFPHFLLIDV
jgi:hypothetical protein